MEKYLDVNLSAKERAEDLLSKMSLEEKMAQTVSIYPNSLFMGTDSVETAKKDCTYGMGTVSTLEMRALPTLEAVCDYQKRMQDMIMEQSPHRIPAIFHMEGLCGGFIQDNTSIPSGINRGASFDPELECQLAEIVARQERAIGVSQILAPVLDISRDSRMGRQGETYGEDPALAAAMGSAFTKGIQESERCDGLKADAVAKHFMGFHNSLAGVHGADSMTPPRQLQEIYGRPFQAAIAEENLHGVMPCYCTFDGEAASTSRHLLTEILRDEMGFDGLAVSDYTAVENAHRVQGLFENLAETGFAAMDAGMDMEWPKKSAYNDELMEQFRSGQADVAVLDRICKRILEAKFRMGLFEHPYTLTGDTLKQEFYHADDKEKSLRAAEEGMVLLKNDGILPLDGKKMKKVAVIGPHAKETRALFGGYTHVAMQEAMYALRCSIAGIDGTGQMIYKDYERYPGTDIQVDYDDCFKEIVPKIKPECKSLFEELQIAMPDTEFVFSYGYPIAGNDHSHFAEALSAIEGADACILTLGGRWSSSSIATMGEGVDATDINLPECQDAFILEAKKKGIPMVGVHFHGRPISSDVADENLNAIVEAFAPSEMGAVALANILSGKVNPSGKLPVSVAYNAGQIPIFYNHPMGSGSNQGVSIGFAEYADCPHTPRYAFGHGCSYTTFAYDDLRLDKQVVSPDGLVSVSVDITNTGSLPGTEIVQLYLKDLHASMVRPCMELQGFARVELAPGETRTVTFEVAPSQMAFLTTDMKWKIEKGQIKVMVGAASDDIRLEETFTISDHKYVRSPERKFYSLGQVR